VAARYAIVLNATTRIILTKPDAMAGAERFSICYGHEHQGTVRTDFPRDIQILRSIRPQYREYAGYGDIGLIREYDDLPENLRTAIADFEAFTGSSAVMISVGPEAEETIVIGDR
jgi:adenylosuccinate synthase